MLHAKLPSFGEHEVPHSREHSPLHKALTAKEEVDPVTGKKKESGTAHAFALLLGQATAPQHATPPPGNTLPSHKPTSIKIDPHMQPADKAPTAELRAKGAQAESKNFAEEPPPVPQAGPAPIHDRTPTVAEPQLTQVRAALPPESVPTQGAILQQSAHLHLNVGNAGELSLHLRMKDGVADVRLDGSASSILRSREPELRLALASSGVAVNHIDIGPAPVSAAHDMGTSTSSDSFAGQSNSQSEQNTRDDEPQFAGTNTARAAPVRAALNGGVYVKA